MGLIRNYFVSLNLEGKIHVMCSEFLTLFNTNICKSVHQMVLPAVGITWNSSSCGPRFKTEADSTYFLDL